MWCYKAWYSSYYYVWPAHSDLNQKHTVSENQNYDLDAPLSSTIVVVSTEKQLRMISRNGRAAHGDGPPTDVWSLACIVFEIVKWCSIGRSNEYDLDRQPRTRIYSI